MRPAPERPLQPTWLRLIGISGLALLLTTYAWWPKFVAYPKTPEEERKSFVVPPGFAVELVAAEPLVRSPMFVEFDEDGRLWVIELPEYNAYAATKPQGKGRIVVLTDTDGDGQYDTRTVFADDLDYPTGLACWNGGVYVGV